MGRRCEAADALAGDVALAGDIRPGDLRAVPMPPSSQCPTAPHAYSYAANHWTT
ncbi:hypothetical protein ACWD9K_35100 [Streptomyces sp. 900116325]